MNFLAPISFVAPALPAPPPNAEPAHLDALATYFEAQARALRSMADEIRCRARRNDAARERRTVAGWRFLMLGGRSARLYAALGCWNAVAGRLGLTSIERAQYSAAQYRKRLKARDDGRRNLEIWKSAVRGEPQKSIAARFDLTARRVRDVIAEAEARASRL